MNVLIDQNISHRIIPYIQGMFSQVKHVRDIGMMDAFDLPLFMEARKLGFHAVITQDEDFYNILLAQGVPPKIIWLRVGNRSTAHLGGILMHNADAIYSFFEDSEQDCLEIYS